MYFFTSFTTAILFSDCRAFDGNYLFVFCVFEFIWWAKTQEIDRAVAMFCTWNWDVLLRFLTGKNHSSELRKSIDFKWSFGVLKLYFCISWKLNCQFTFWMSMETTGTKCFILYMLTISLKCMSSCLCLVYQTPKANIKTAAKYPLPSKVADFAKPIFLLLSTFMLC